MNNIMESLLREYAELKEQEKSVQSKIKELGSQILSKFQEKGFEKLPTDFGTFTVSKKSTWVFSENVKKLQEEEKATGIAKIKETPYLLFSGPKKQEES